MGSGEGDAVYQVRTHVHYLEDGTTLSFDYRSQYTLRCPEECPMAVGRPSEDDPAEAHESPVE